MNILSNLLLTKQITKYFIDQKAEPKSNLMSKLDKVILYSEKAMEELRCLKKKFSLYEKHNMLLHVYYSSKKKKLGKKFGYEKKKMWKKF